MNLEEKLYTSTEVAKVLGVSLRSVYRYLDQGKLNAEIKTATGRLRFTKQDILNFLYPDGDIDSDAVASRFSKVGVTSEKESDVSSTQGKSTISQEDLSKEVTTEQQEPEMPEESAMPVEPEMPTKPVMPEEEPEEEIDWLAKFRSAAKEYSMGKTSNEVVQEEEQEDQGDQGEEKQTVDSLSSLGNSVDEETPLIQCKYYKSLLGGLKEIAQNIDKVARKSGIDYAFTLHAGLSLEKPLKKPFSLLHVYIDPAAEVLFQKMLQLEESDPANAQLCIMIPNDPSIFANKVEKHGLYVVDMSQMREDFELMGMSDEYVSLL